MTGFDRELERARDAMRRRDADGRYRELYEPLSQAPLQRLQSRERAFAGLLRRSGLPSLAGIDILDLGCGGGRDLARLIGMGADPSRLAGVDLSVERVATARTIVPTARLEVASAHETPFPDRSFDLVLQQTVLSSVVDPLLQEAIAREMVRLLRPGGRIFWYDAFRASRSPDFVPLSRARIGELFPSATVLSRVVTLRWGLLYRVAPRSRVIAEILESLPVCCSHLAAVIRPAPPSA